MSISRNSRFGQTPRVLDGQKERYIEWVAPRYGIVENEGLYIVTQSDLYRPYLISHQVYGAVDLWWLILHYNHVIDPYSLEIGDRLRIPNIGTVNRLLAARLRTDARILAAPKLLAVPRSLVYRVPVYVRPTTAAELAGEEEEENTDSTLFIYGFQVPEGLSGQIHFQVTASSSLTFVPTRLTKFTLGTGAQARWFYYNPSALSGAGSYVAFPSGGLNGEVYEGQTVYYNIGAGDGLVAGVEYWVRYRAWSVTEGEFGDWNVSPPIIIPP